MREFELRQPVARWLLSRGLAPVLECQSLNNCDIVGVRFEQRPARLVEMVAVELKLADVARVRSQCQMHLGKVTETWAALPEPYAGRAAAKLASTGIGVLSVSVSSCAVLLMPTIFEPDLYRWRRPMHQRRNEYLERMKHPLMYWSRTKIEETP